MGATGFVYSPTVEALVRSLGSENVVMVQPRTDMPLPAHGVAVVHGGMCCSRVCACGCG